MAAGNRKANELYITRLYDAPLSMVWDAWTDPEQVKLWWGPRGFTLTTHSKDLRPGGHWRYTMHGPDGTNYPNHTVYHEVEEGKKLVYDHGGSDDRPPLFRVTALFSEENGKTKLEMTMALSTPEAAKEIKAFIKKANGESTWDRLAEYVEKGKSGKEIFVIARTFHCDLKTMHALWTKPEHFSQWLAPTGMEMQVVDGEIKEGSTVTYQMSGNSMVLRGRIRYHELRSDRLVYSQEFLDEKGNLSRHPMLPVWPESVLTTVKLAQEDAEHTRVTVLWEPKGTKEEIEAFVKMKPGMMGGWTGSFDKLEALLE